MVSYRLSQMLTSKLLESITVIHNHRSYTNLFPSSHLTPKRPIPVPLLLSFFKSLNTQQKFASNKWQNYCYHKCLNLNSWKCNFYTQPQILYKYSPPTLTPTTSNPFTPVPLLLSFFQSLNTKSQKFLFDKSGRKWRRKVSGADFCFSIFPEDLQTSYSAL